MDTIDDPFVHWFQEVERRALADLTFQEVRRAVQALSSLYVERRGRIDTGAAFTGAGKRAAFAMYYGPLHFLLVREIVRALDARIPPSGSVLDIGCGTGVAGVAWALELQPRPEVAGLDRNAWAAGESRWTYRQLGIRGSVKIGELGPLRIPANTALIAAFTINEVDPTLRERLRRDFLDVARRGMPVLIVEPIARRVSSWWNAWAKDWKASGGRDDEWRFRIDLPERLALLDKAAGLDHRELKGRSLWLPGLT